MINQKQIEEKWQKIWEENKVFEAEPNKKQEKYFGTVAYPYANSAMHIGHGKSNVTAEIFLRFQRLLGKNVLFPMGFHISGTPVLAVADAIKNNDKKQIKITKDAICEYLDDDKEIEKTLKSFENPKNIAKFFSETIEDSFKKIGIGIDWRRKFTSGEPIYNKFIEWQYKKLKDLNILTQGKYPILYSPQEENAVGEDDIVDGDTDKVTISEMTYILFESVKTTSQTSKVSEGLGIVSKKNFLKGTYFAVSTLRPDALFGTTNLWIDKNADIVKIKVGKQILIITKNCLSKFEHQFNGIKIISEHKGKDFIGEKVITPITKREVIIAEADFLDSFHGTGIVYSSPAGAPHDYMALIKAKKEGRLPKEVEVINTVITFDKKGNKISYQGSCPAEDKIKKFKVVDDKDETNLELAKQELYKEEHYGGKLNENTGEFNGMYIKQAKDKVKNKLIELNLGGTLLETSRKAFTRHKDRVIVANLEGQWFLDYSDEKVKQQAYDLLKSINYLPEKLKQTQKGYLEWVTKRPCARKRGLGTPLPYDKDWVIEPLSDSTIYQLLYLIIHIIRREKIPVESLTLELFDYIYLGLGNLKKISKQIKINEKIIEELKEEINYWNGCDLRYVGQPHMSNHMSFLIYHYALIFDNEKLKKFHPKTVVVGGMLQRNGEKMSKSKGNVIPLSKVGKEFGVDLYRLYIATAASFDVQMDFRDEEISQLEKKFDKFKELMSNAKKLKVKKYNEFNETDKWLISRFYSNVQIYFENMKNMKIREAYIYVLYEVLNDINYHTRRTSETSQTQGVSDGLGISDSLNQTLEVIRFFFNDYLKIMTPVIPHITEELFIGEGKANKYISLAKFTTKPQNYINKEIEEIENISKEIITEILRQKESRNISEITKVIIVQASKKRFELFNKLKIILEETKDFKKIIPVLMKDFPEENKFILKFVPKTLGEGLSAYLQIDDEKKTIENLGNFIKKEFNASLGIKSAEEMNINSNQLIPGRPQIILE